ncbi:hypothetical protein AB5I41_17060 [Sphingomonas sp. MMS24-JH45]
MESHCRQSRQRAVPAGRRRPRPDPADTRPRRRDRASACARAASPTSVQGFQAAARLNRNIRFAEGSRAYIAFDTPVTYQKVRGAEEWRLYTATALVLPLSSRFTISPRLSIGC